MATSTGQSGRVDRQSTTPFHLKLFYRTGGFHRVEDFQSTSPTSPSSEFPPHLQIYTWQTCTLRELSHLLTSALPSLLPEPFIGTRLSYRLIFPDMRDAGRPGPGRFSSKELGSIVIGANGSGQLPSEEEASIVPAGPMAGALSGEPDKTLSDGRFVIGDYVSCAIFPPMPDGSIAPPPASGSGMRGGRFAGDYAGRGQNRENGFGGYRGRSGPRGGFGGGGGFDQAVPMGEWRRGERLPEGSGGGRGYGGSRGRGRY